MHLATFDTNELFDIYHVNDNISDTYYDNDMSRFQVDLSDNLNSFLIGKQMECQ